MSDLFLFNSLSKKLEKFQPEDPNNVKVYICGPTVYDVPHIGHARTYISFDIMRRIMQEYFKYDITLVMNITNIDDKIINRSNESNVPWKQLADRFEHEFLVEMNRLNVLRPSFITRVNEYVPEIIEFIDRLESKGFAYELNGSVYFDLDAYKKSHRYNLLRPETVKSAEASPASSVMEGEVLNSDVKKTQGDFVLWKASKANEPSYSSKWGPGRPGWHIECSVMASEVFGSKLDIHAGGIDLCFPHHENEIAQCHAYFYGDGSEKDPAAPSDSWVRYFLHTGHLNIDGRKMSKSLKNFLTISDILKECSPEALRILFIHHSWCSPMNYDPEQIKRAEATRKKLYNFISNVDAVVLDRVNNTAGALGTCAILDQMDRLSVAARSRGSEQSGTEAGRCLIRSTLSDLDKSLYNALTSCKAIVDESFCNNLNTSKALDAILNLITATNASLRLLHSDILLAINDFVKRILKIFGLLEHRSTSSQDSEAPKALDSMANVLNEFRSHVRLAAKNKEEPKRYFELCDSVRAKAKECGYQIDDEKDKSLIRKI